MHNIIRPDRPRRPGRVCAIQVNKFFVSLLRQRIAHDVLVFWRLIYERFVVDFELTVKIVVIEVDTSAALERGRATVTATHAAISVGLHGKHVSVAVPNYYTCVQFDQDGREKEREGEQLECVIVQDQEGVLVWKVGVILNPNANIRQAGIKAERGQTRHEHLEYFDAKVGHQVARLVFHDAVDQH